MLLVDHNQRLTTAEILYLMPDFQSILQSFVWQRIDTAPNYPKLQKFLAFWEENLDGPIHSVRIVSHEIVKSPAKCHSVSELVLH